MDVATNATKIFELLVQYLCVEHIDYAIELGLQGQYHISSERFQHEMCSCSECEFLYVVCLFVCVHLSHAGIVSNRLNIGSYKQCHRISQSSSFLVPKVCAKFEQGHPQQGRQMQMGRLNSLS